MNEATTPVQVVGETTPAVEPEAKGTTPALETEAKEVTPAVEAETGATTPALGSEAPKNVEYGAFSAPEGLTLDQPLLDSVTPLFKEFGLDQSQAQKLIDFQFKQNELMESAKEDSFNTLMDTWKEQSRNDKDFGGDKFEENVGVARKAIDQFGTPELKELLDSHGVGNHPEVIRFMVKVGHFTSEDVPGNSSPAITSAKNRVSLLYPNDRNN
jgi:hypothetical protein